MGDLCHVSLVGFKAARRRIPARRWQQSHIQTEVSTPSVPENPSLGFVVESNVGVVVGERRVWYLTTLNMRWSGEPVCG